MQPHTPSAPTPTRFQFHATNVLDQARILYSEIRPTFGENGFKTRVFERLAELAQAQPNAIVKSDGTFDAERLHEVALLEFKQPPVTTDVWLVYLACAYVVSALAASIQEDEVLGFEFLVKAGYYLGCATGMSKGEALAFHAAMRTAREENSRGGAKAKHASSTKLKDWVVAEFRSSKKWTDFTAAAESISALAEAKWAQDKKDFPLRDPVRRIQIWIGELPDRWEFVQGRKA